MPKAREWADGQSVDSLGMKPGGKFNGHWEPEHFDKVARGHVDLDNLMLKARYQARAS